MLLSDCTTATYVCPCIAHRTGADARDGRWGLKPLPGNFSFFRNLCEKVTKGPAQNKVEEILGVLCFGGRLIYTLTFKSPTGNPVLPTQR